MTTICLKNVSLTYPVLGGASRSLKRDVIDFVTGRRSESGKIHSVTALRNLSLTLNDGDFLGLVGHNGAGKTTLLKVLSGIYPVTQGELKLQGAVSALLGNSVGMQPELTGYENIKLSCIVKGCTASEIKTIIADVEEFTELNEFLHLPIKKYSSGMQARLAFAVSTAVHPEILLLDEVMGTGDASFINKAQKRMQNLMAKANIMILASHSTELIKQFCNLALWLDHGEMRALGGVDEVVGAYLSSVSYV